MTNKSFKLVMPVLALVFVITVFGGCASSGKSYVVLDSHLVPDNRSAVVYIYDIGSSNAEIWDGETAVGTFEGVPSSRAGCIQWRTTPGARTFIARRTNNANLKLNLQVNRTYNLEVVYIPSPGRSRFVALREIDQERVDSLRRRYRFEDITYSDEWRQNFANENNGRRLNAVREYLAGL